METAGLENVRQPVLVSVIVPAYNAAATLSHQLRALGTQTYAGAWEIVVADNGSRDGTAGIVRAWQLEIPHLRMVVATQEQGAAYARNAGVAAAEGDLLAFCDADDVVDPCWLEELVRTARSSDAVGGGFGLGHLNDATVLRWRQGQIPEDGLMGTLEFLPFALTSNLAVWRDAFEEVGGFPRYEGAAGEDVAFSWNLQLVGRSLTYASGATVHHRFRGDLGGLMKQSHRYGMAQARLYKEFRIHGARRRSWGVVARTWTRLVLTAVPALWDQGARGRWVREVAFEAGQLRGAWRHRVLFAG
jgi:glycosyltransferase involved in cell wall biosynthesis